MRKSRLAPAIGWLVSAALASFSAAGAAPSFQQAVALYNSGKYTEALGAFKQFAASYPTNAMSHYYMALCYQSMGNRSSARQEFTLTSQYGSGSIKGYADKALQFLSGSGSGGSSSALAGSAVAAQPTGGASGGGGNRAAMLAPVASSATEVLEFYTDWCHVCKEFEPIWQSTSSKMSGVRFQKYNAEDSSNAALVQKYNVHAYPTLVYLDKSGNVLKNTAGAFNTSAGFEQSIKCPM